MPQKCSFCSHPVPEYRWNVDGPGARVECPRCGSYWLSERVAQRLFENEITPGVHPDLNERRLAHASGAIRELVESGIKPRVEDLDSLLSTVAPPADPLESIDRVLLHIFRRTGSAAEYVQINLALDYPIAYARDPHELGYFLQKACELGYLEQVGDGAGYRMRLEGWRRIREMKSLKRDSRQAFVAMWFDSSMDAAFFDGFRPALEAAGYRPVRIDQQEHNEKIDDRIIAEIRKSGLLVADFTGHRGGVYFEAGFAMGLGIPVIWTCHASEIGGAHFDTRQYNHIVWNSVEDLREKLLLRIEATLGITHA